MIEACIYKSISYPGAINLTPNVVFPFYYCSKPVAIAVHSQFEALSVVDFDNGIISTPSPDPENRRKYSIRRPITKVPEKKWSRVFTRSMGKIPR